MAEIHGTEYSNLMEASVGGIGGAYQIASLGGAAEISGATAASESYESYSASSDVAGVGLEGSDVALGSIGGGGYSQYLESYSSGVGAEGASALVSGGPAQYASYESESYSSTVGGESAGLFGAGVGGGISESAALSSVAGVESGLASYSAAAAAGAGVGFGAGEGVGPLLPLNLYKIQRDSNPTVITRSLPGSASVYRQNVHIRFLKPPTPPAPGPLIIKEVRPPQPRPAPPIVIRQRAPRPKTPPPIVLRERPPVMPLVQKTKVVVRKLAALPPPERQVIVERYRALPPKPQDIIIERWIPYGRMPRRKVIVQRAARQAAYKAKKNVIIEYIPGPVRRERHVRNLGVVAYNPMAYASQYGASLLESHALVSTARRLGVVENISPPMVVHAAGFSAEGLGTSLASYGGGLAAEGGAVSSFESYESSSVGGGVVGGLSAYESGVAGGLVSGGDLGLYGQSLYSSGGQYGVAGLGEVAGASSFEYSSSGLAGAGALQSAEFASEVSGVEGASSSYESSSYSVTE